MNTYYWTPVTSKLNVIQFRQGKIQAEIISHVRFSYTIYYDGPDDLALMKWGDCTRLRDAKRAVKRQMQRIAEDFRLMALYI